MKTTKESLNLTQKISDSMDGSTFHHHYYILYDIINLFPQDQEINYVEIGCYAGGSACLVSQRKNTNIFSIDLGNPINPEVAIKNMQKFNNHSNKFEYIQDNSQLESTLVRLMSFINDIDVLFIDGDHSYNGVKNDFNLYSPLVKKGGYIVFDDYNDHVSSPEVKPAVNEIVSTLVGYEIIGTLPNVYGARPNTLLEGNCYVIKKI
jgi:predicted O-methyltransferase YrrM